LLNTVSRREATPKRRYVIPDPDGKPRPDDVDYIKEVQLARLPTLLATLVAGRQTDRLSFISAEERRAFFDAHVKAQSILVAAITRELERLGRRWQDVFEHPNQLTQHLRTLFCFLPRCTRPLSYWILFLFFSIS